MKKDDLEHVLDPAAIAIAKANAAIAAAEAAYYEAALARWNKNEKI